MHRRSLIRLLGLATMASVGVPLPGWTAGTPQPVSRGWRASQLRDHPLVGHIWDAGLQRFVPQGTLIGALTRASFALLGEVHDNPDHHAVQAELLGAIAARNADRAVVFEQFDREYEPVLQRAMAKGDVDAEAVATAVNLDRKGWNWAFYKPLVDIALRHGMGMHAGNLSRASGAQIARQGMAVLEPVRIAALRLDSGWSDAREQALREIIALGHCGALPESAIPAMAAAQRARDATLAEALLAVTRDGAVLIAGNGHVRRDIGVPVYLSSAAPRRPSCALGILEVDAAALEPQAYLQSATPDARRYDFVFFTPRWERPDPCEAFSR
ncbi:MAG TPA: ChaN family lipoprotein [Burkholderiales bacterium]|nr:ChaN family lipoprotein [Burkholderiales bacterium]